MGKGHILTPLERIENIEENGVGTGAGLKDASVKVQLKNWVLDEETNTYKYEITLDKIAEGCNPVILLDPTNEVATDDELESYSYICGATIENKTIKLTAENKPLVSFNVVIKGVIGDGAGVVDTSELEEAIIKNTSDITELDSNMLKIKHVTLIDDTVSITTTGTQIAYSKILEAAELTECELIVYRGALARWVEGYITNATDYDRQQYFMLWSSKDQPYEVDFTIFYK